ncbi:MAG: hypothetical protein R3B51_05780 [Thermodesulfobacteriota bacterium]
MTRKFIILDEPMRRARPHGAGARDKRTSSSKRRGRGKTILLSSHMLSDVEALCDRVGIIMGGTSRRARWAKLRPKFIPITRCVEGAPEEVKRAMQEMRVEMEHRSRRSSSQFDEDIRRGVIEAVAKTRAEIISLHPVKEIARRALRRGGEERKPRGKALAYSPGKGRIETKPVGRKEMRKNLSGVAHNAFMEAIRDRVLYSLVLFALLMISELPRIPSASAEQYNKIVKDLSLTAISVIGILISKSSSA